MRCARSTLARHASPCTRNLRSISMATAVPAALVRARDIKTAAIHAHYSVALEQGDRLDMRRVREHVHHAGTAKFEAVLIDQRAGIACERGGMARHIHHAMCTALRQV